MGKVSITKVGDDIREAVERSIELLGGWGAFVSRDDRVMLKPNLNGVEGYTNIAVTEAVIQAMQDMGVRKVFMAEATFGTSKHTAAFFEKSGYNALAQRYGIDIYNLNESEVVEAKVESPQVMERIRLAREVFEADKIINMPNMKVHYATGVTLAMKNLKGLLVGDEKRRFHETGLDGAIIDLNKVVKPALNLVDCIECMERMGPRGGDTVELGLLIAGADPAEVDCVGCRVMGFEPDEIRHIDMFTRLMRIDPDAVEVLGETVESVKRDFVRVDLSRIVPEGVNIHGASACSSCMNAFLLSCQVLQGSSKEQIEVFMGSVIEDSQVEGALRLAFGNCVPAEGDFHERIKGCPPYPFALGETLAKRHQP